jgi:tetratricopeptide (TPR) repeat protein
MPYLDRPTLSQKGILMHRSPALTWAFLTSVLAMIGLANVTARYDRDPFPSLAVSLSSPVARLSDFAGIAMGFRRLTADIAWIQTLVYYGTTDETIDSEAAENGGGHYPLFLAYCQRVAEIDPNFNYIFYYGGGVLGWNLNRLDEAEQLLKEGVDAHPKEWRFQQYLAGLAYQKNHNMTKLTEFLQGFAEQSDCPNLLRSILANIYKKQKRYKEAIHIWSIVYETGDPLYLDRVETQIREMYPLARAQEIGRKTH